MKGTIVKCMERLVTEKFGPAMWMECLKKAGQPESKFYSTIGDAPDAEVLAIMGSIGQVTGLSQTQVMDAFGEYWCTVYAPGIYKSFFDSAKSTRELLMKLDSIHVGMTRAMKEAKPPRFTYEWKSDNYLVMQYESERGLVALMPGLIAGLGKYYKDKPSVELLGNAVHVHFA